MVADWGCWAECEVVMLTLVARKNEVHDGTRLRNLKFEAGERGFG